MDHASFIAEYKPWLIIGAFLLVVLGQLIGQIYSLGRKLSEPEKLLYRTPGGLGPHEKAFMAFYQDWLASARLRYRTAFQFQNIHVAVYQYEDQPRFFSFMFHKQTTFSAETYFEDLKILDTSSSGTIGMLPRPGAYAQSIPGASAQEIWEKHLEGEAHLKMKLGLRPERVNRPYEETMMEALRVRMQHNRSQFLWPVRVLYRYFVTRHLIKGRTIAQQFS